MREESKAAFLSYASQDAQLTRGICEVLWGAKLRRGHRYGAARDQLAANLNLPC
jgi:hypothetical protein